MVRSKIFLARSNLTWMGTGMVLWQIALAFVAQCSFANVGAVVNHPYLMSILIFTSVLVSAVSVLINMFYWGPSAGTRKKMSQLDPCRRGIDESDISWEQRSSRIIRSYGDQWVETWVLATSSFVLIFMIRFYWFNGVNQFQPLPPVFTSVQFDQYIQSLGFAVSMLFIAATTVLIALCTYSDMFKRFMLHYYIPTHVSPTTEHMTTNTGSDSLLLGAAVY